MKYIFSILCLSLVSCFSSCNLFSEDDEPKTELDKLPPLTTSGENTFGCLVNGKAFVVRNTARMSAIYQGGGFSLSGEIDNSEIDANVSIFVGNLIEEGKRYFLINNTTHQGNYDDQIKTVFMKPHHRFKVA